MERIPKNIRQIGGREERLKTYVEDYVGTYLRKLQEEREEDGAVGMLAGSWQKEGGNDCVFISGALEVSGAHTDGGRLRMTDEAWDDAYGSLGTYFSGQELCGIFVCEGTCRRFRRQALFAAAREIFPDSARSLLFVLTEEGEEIVYWITQREEERLQGYLCYFERNEAMQEYMMDHLSRRQIEKEELPARRNGREAAWRQDRPETAAKGSDGAFENGGAVNNGGAAGDPVESFRERMQRQQEEKAQKEQQRNASKGGGRGLFGLCAVMAAVVFASGFLLMQREQGGIRIADILQQLQIDPSQLLPVSGQPESDTEEVLEQSRPVVVEEVPGNVYPTQGDKPIAEPSGGQPEETAAGDPAAAPGVSQESIPAGEGAPSESAAVPGAADGEPPAMQDPGTETPAQAGTDPPAGQPPEGQTPDGQNPAEQPPAEQIPDGQSPEPTVPQSAETAAPPPAETAVSTGVTYVVEPGDSLYSISRKFYGTEAMVSKIQELNGLSNADLIKEGQSLILP